jgi:hypothetical protein
MPDVSGIAALDVLIGLFFLYFLLSIACSALNELVATAFSFRAKTLEEGIRNLLADDHYVSVFYKHPRVLALFGTNRKGEPHRKPSYLPSRTFALTVLDTFAPPQPGVEDHDLLKRAQAALELSPTESLPGGHPVNKTILEMLRDAVNEARRLAGPTDESALAKKATDALDKVAGGESTGLTPTELEVILRVARTEAANATTRARAEVDRFRAALERSFDEVMDRASGWYKRRTHYFLLAIAVVLVAAVNADSFTIGQRLWKDKALRAAVVAQANKTVQAGQQECATPKDASAADRAGACIDQVQELNIPLGWSKENRPAELVSWASGGKLIGLLITALALSLGAPFWFDLLGKVSRLRGAGPPSPPADTTPLAADPTQRTTPY